MPKVRVGVVLLVPPPADAEINALRRALGDPALGRIAPHLTLVPPVNVNNERLEEALGLVRTAAAATPALRLTLGPARTFLPANPVLFLGVGGDVEQVGELRGRLFRAPLERSVGHEFVPHVTLADGIDADVVTAGLVALAAYEATITVARVHVLQQGDDRVWLPLADAPLARPAVVGRGGIAVELTVSAQLEPGAGTSLVHAVPFAVTARLGAQVAGVATGRVDAGICHLHELAVHASECHQGVGARLLAAVESLAAEHDCAELLAADHPFLRRHGWVAGRRRLRPPPPGPNSLQ